jgi:nucleoid DNA-binding protein
MSKNTITKKEMAERIARHCGVSPAESLKMFQFVLDEVSGALIRGDRMEFRDFGVFETIRRRPRMALNPKTLVKVPVAERVVVRFKPGRLLKQEVAAVFKTKLAAKDAGK